MTTSSRVMLTIETQPAPVPTGAVVAGFQVRLTLQAPGATETTLTSPVSASATVLFDAVPHGRWSVSISAVGSDGAAIGATITGEIAVGLVDPPPPQMYDAPVGFSVLVG